MVLETAPYNVERTRNKRHPLLFKQHFTGNVFDYVNKIFFVEAIGMVPSVMNNGL